MTSTEKDRLAAEVTKCWEDFQEALSADKRKYPFQQFKAFWTPTKSYAELTKSDSLIRRRVACVANGLVDFLEVERKRVPGDVLLDAERLERLVFNGYDPLFRGGRTSGIVTGDDRRTAKARMQLCATRTRGATGHPTEAVGVRNVQMSLTGRRFLNLCPRPSSLSG
jgi:hypothetical protein